MHSRHAGQPNAQPDWPRAAEAQHSAHAAPFRPLPVAGKWRVGGRSRRGGAVASLCSTKPCTLKLKPPPYLGQHASECSCARAKGTHCVGWKDFSMLSLTILSPRADPNAPLENTSAARALAQQQQQQQQQQPCRWALQPSGLRTTQRGRPPGATSPRRGRPPGVQPKEADHHGVQPKEADHQGRGSPRDCEGPGWDPVGAPDAAPAEQTRYGTGSHSSQYTRVVF